MLNKENPALEKQHSGFVATAMFVLLVVLGIGLMPVRSQADLGLWTDGNTCAQENEAELRSSC